MGDLTDIDAGQTVKIVGASSDGTEQTPVGSSANRELFIRDTHDNGGLDKVLVLTSGVPAELKVGASRKTLRKYVIFEAQDTGITWGFTNSTQSFDVFKSQLLMVPVGENTQIWFLYSGGGTGDVAIGEIS